MDRIKQKLVEDINHPCNSTNCCQPCMSCKEDKKRIVRYMDQGHTYHCACRQTWGDGECECQTDLPPASKLVLESMTETVPKCHGC